MYNKFKMYIICKKHLSTLHFLLKFPLEIRAIWSYLLLNPRYQNAMILHKRILQFDKIMSTWLKTFFLFFMHFAWENSNVITAKISNSFVINSLIPPHHLTNNSRIVIIMSRMIRWKGWMYVWLRVYYLGGTTSFILE